MTLSIADDDNDHRAFLGLTEQRRREDGQVGRASLPVSDPIMMQPLAAVSPWLVGFGERIIGRKCSSPNLIILLQLCSWQQDKGRYTRVKHAIEGGRGTGGDCGSSREVVKATIREEGREGEGAMLGGRHFMLMFRSPNQLALKQTTTTGQNSE